LKYYFYAGSHNASAGEAVARALEAGADIINDISALEDAPEIGKLCAQRGAAVLLMHKKGVPENMQEGHFYTDVVREVVEYLAAAAKKAESYGLESSRIILDPGIGANHRHSGFVGCYQHRIHQRKRRMGDG
jgi:dihydropteroate synthase